MMSLEFMEGVLKCSGTIQKIFSHCKFLRNLLAFSFSPIYWWSLLLSPGCYFPPLLLGGFLGPLACPKKVPYFIGVTKFLEGLIRACNRCPGNYFPCLLVSPFSDKEGLLGYITCSPTVLLWWPYFLLIM